MLLKKYSFFVSTISSAGNEHLSPSETAKIVAKRFYDGDKATPKEHTTAPGFANPSGIQEMVAEDKNSEYNLGHR